MKKKKKKRKNVNISQIDKKNEEEKSLNAMKALTLQQK